MLRLRARRLIASANELLAIARELEGVADLPDDISAEPCHATISYSDDHPVWLDRAQRLYADRRRRTKLFDSSLFGEPAWDMLLDLFVAAKKRKRVSVTSACIGADVPVTTGLRWISVLEGMGMVRRESDPKDARRAFIHLTADAYSRMIEYFSYDVPVADSEQEAA
jgi:hypothetical protein